MIAMSLSVYHQGMLTHFAHVLMDDMGWHWLVERTDTGVHMEILNHDGSQFGKIVDTWADVNVDFGTVKEFVEKEQQLEYSSVQKNCKHFCYDFRRELLNKDETFHDYCQYMENNYEHH